MLDEVSNHQTMQRARGKVRLAFDHNDGKTKLKDLHQSGCLKLMLPRNHSPVPDAVLINTAGGLTGGDQLTTEVNLNNQAELRLATQTAERIYKSTGDAAKVSLNFNLQAGARLDWLAQETILFEGGNVRRSINAHMAKDASLLLVEPIVLGRISMGEALTKASLHDSWRIHRDGELIFADETKLRDFEAISKPAALNGAKAIATILLIDPLAESLKDKLLAQEISKQVESGISAWNQMLVLRAMSKDPLELRKALCRVIETIRGRELPRVWTM